MIIDPQRLLVVGGACYDLGDEQALEFLKGLRDALMSAGMVG